MRIKSYFSKSVDEAMNQAREELGSDALLLNTRKVMGGEPGHSGGYEVVFGITEAQAPEPVRQAPAAIPAPQSVTVTEDLSSELGKLHARMDELRGLIERSSKNFQTGRILPELSATYARLLSADVDPLLSQEIISRLDALSGQFYERTSSSVRVDAGRLEELVRIEIERRVTVDPQLGDVVALIGPTGAGKTTSLMKLAVSVQGRPVHLVSLDTSGIGLQMRLEYFAAEEGMGFHAVPSLDQLPAIVEEARKNEVVLIDTPGYAGGDDRGMETAAGVLASCPGIDVHLVVPGYMKASDLRRTIRRYEAFRASKLLVTKLDETQTFGSMYSGAAWAGLSLSFMTHGPAVPDAIRPASLEDFIAMVLDTQPMASRQVA
jgi:flagellar biosynthesis protein FlhF